MSYVSFISITISLAIFSLIGGTWLRRGMSRVFLIILGTISVPCVASQIFDDICRVNGADYPAAIMRCIVLICLVIMLAEILFKRQSRCNLFQ